MSLREYLDHFHRQIVKLEDYGYAESISAQLPDISEILDEVIRYLL